MDKIRWLRNLDLVGGNFHSSINSSQLLLNQLIMVGMYYVLKL